MCSELSRGDRLGPAYNLTFRKSIDTIRKENALPWATKPAQKAVGAVTQFTTYTLTLLVTRELYTINNGLAPRGSDATGTKRLAGRHA